MGDELSQNGLSGETQREIKVATPDQEAWVKSRIQYAIRLSHQLQREKRVGADMPALTLGLNGILDGVVCEVIETLEMKPSFINIQNPYPIEQIG